MSVHFDNKPILVMMAGLPGSGKTTLARELGKALAWPVISKDFFMSSLKRCGGAIMTDKETGWIAYEQLFDQAKDLLVQQRLSIILDTAAHRPFIQKHVEQIVRASSAEVKIIHCSAPGNIRLARLSKRADDNRYDPFMLPIETSTIIDESWYFRHLPDDRLRIDTQKPLEVCLAECLEHVHLAEAALIG